VLLAISGREKARRENVGEGVHSKLIVRLRALNVSRNFGTHLGKINGTLALAFSTSRPFTPRSLPEAPRLDGRSHDAPTGSGQPSPGRT
jgi:hypothetical protein